MHLFNSKTKLGKLTLGSLVLLILSMTSCLPLGPDSIEDFDIVASLYNDGYNFGKNKTYAMPDNIAHIRESGTNDNISRDFDELILQQIDLKMQALGYAKVDTSTTADVILTVAITVGERNLYGEYNIADYWGSWFNSFGYDYSGGWSYYYPNYGSTDYYGLQFGTVLITLSDHKNADPVDKTVPAEWIGVINGLAEGSFSNTASRLISTINQCFDQSPYLKVN